LCLQGAPLQKGCKEETFAALAADIQRYTADAAQLTKEIAELDEDISIWQGDVEAATKRGGGVFARAGQPLQKGLMYFIDYSYLYQYKREERHQSNSFQKAMGNMHVLYASYFTIKEDESNSEKQKELGGNDESSATKMNQLNRRS